MHCGEFQGALELFDRVLAEKPDHALALDCSAHCCFLLEKLTEGLLLPNKPSNLVPQIPTGIGVMENTESKRIKGKTFLIAMAISPL